MHRRIVKHFGRARHTQESGALLIGFSADARHFQHLRTGGELTVFFPVFDNVPGAGGIDTGNIGKK